MNFNKHQKKLFKEENSFQLSLNLVISNSVGDKSNRFRKAGPQNGHIITKIYRLAGYVNTLTHKANNATDFVVSIYT